MRVFMPRLGSRSLRLSAVYDRVESQVAPWALAGNGDWLGDDHRETMNGLI